MADVWLSLSPLSGIDLGSLNTIVAVARNRGVDVVRFRSKTPHLSCL